MTQPWQATCILLLALSAAVPALADAPEVPPTTDGNQSPFDVDLAIDLPLTLGTPVVFVMPVLVAEDTVRPWCGLECDRDNINPVDRAVMSDGSQKLADISDILLWAGMALPFAFDALDVAVSSPSDGWNGFGTDTLVLGEAISITLSISHILNFVVRRPRPYVYDPDVSDDFKDRSAAAASFPSGHTAYSFCWATTYSYIYMKRHPNSRGIWPVWLGTYGYATAVGVLRVMSNAHFLTDGIAGAALGIVVGWLVPYLRQRDRDEKANPADSSPRVSLAPMAVDSGFGASLTVR